MGDLYLIDGSGLAYRAFYALDSSLSTSTGLPTNAVYGVTKMILKLIKDYIRKNIDAVIFAMDKKTVTYRHKLLETYKAQRPKAPDEFKKQIPYISNMVSALGIKVMAVEGFEADDLISTLAIKGKNEFDKVYIVTSDKDMFQILDDKINILRVGRGITDLILYTVDRFIEKYGFPPKRIVDYLALVGDAVDNIPGVKGIGEKTAKELLKQFQSIEEIYNNLSSIPQRLRKKLMEGKESAFLSKKLIQLVLDVPIEIDWKECIYRGFKKELQEILVELEFKSIMEELGLDTSLILKKRAEKVGIDLSKKGKYFLIKAGEYKKIFEIFKNSQEISFDTETTSLDPHKAEIVGISLSDKVGIGYYLDLSNVQKNDLNKILSEIKEFLSKKKIIGQNLKYDYSIMKAQGFELPSPHFDTMIAAYLLNPDSRGFNLDSLAEKYLGYKTTKYKEVLSQTLFSRTLMDVAPQEVSEYSGEDADISFRLYTILKPKLEEMELMRVFKEIEMPLIPVLSEMELNGVYFDISYLKELEKEFSEKLKRLHSEMEELAGVSFNPNSPKQVSEVLFKKLKLVGKNKTKSGHYSTSAEALEAIKDKHPIVEKLLEYRKYQKLLSSYIQSIPKLVNRKTGRVHTSFNQTGAATGRLSSSEPNLQNLPVRDPEGEKIRKAVKAQRDDWILLSADYSQIELRVLAHMSQDPMLIKAYKENRDIHTLTASKLFNVDESFVSEEMRRIGKMVNFSIVYGVTPYGLSIRTGISVKDAQKFITRYFELYKGVSKYLQLVIKKAKENGYVETLFGRKRFLKKLNLNKSEFERVAVNSPIQGTAADIMKLAMIKLYERLPSYAKMILQVHDEIVLEIPQEKVEEIKEIVKNTMENVVKLSIPLKVDISVSKEWK